MCNYWEIVIKIVYTKLQCLSQHETFKERISRLAHMQIGLQSAFDSGGLQKRFSSGFLSQSVHTHTGLVVFIWPTSFEWLTDIDFGVKSLCLPCLLNDKSNTVETRRNQF